MTSFEQQIIALRNDMHDLQARVDQMKAQLDDVIRDALAAGESAAKIATWAGLSKPRIYQIRDHTR
jgi:outer membrane murein-binding lipoprotein Lpp